MQFDELLEVISLLYQYNDYALMFIKPLLPSTRMIIIKIMMLIVIWMIVHAAT